MNHLNMGVPMGAQPSDGATSGTMDEREFRQFVANEEAKIAGVAAVEAAEIQKKFDAVTAPLRRVVDVARGFSGQSIRAASFLLSLYDGERFPFDLRDLRTVDREIFDDCMAVIYLDRDYLKNVARYFKNGHALFEQIAVRQRIPDATKTKRRASPR